MKKISKIQASKRILAIAKNVAMVQASNNKLTPLEIAKVQKTVGLILAAADIDQPTLAAIQALDGKVPSGNKILTDFQKEKSNIDFNKKFRVTPQIKKFLDQKKLVLRPKSGPMRVSTLLAILKELIDKFQSKTSDDEDFDNQEQ